VLAVLAAKLGWAPVEAVDRDPGSVEAALANARASGVSVAARAGDLALEPPPPARGLAANVPAPLHGRLAAALAEPLPRVALLSGFGLAEADAVVAPYERRGLREQRRVERDGWTIVVLET
jgi:ribosomal protein L11 methyltransferase